jgi:hypothetical protein
MNALNKLISIGGDALGPTILSDALGISTKFGLLGEQLFALLKNKNGFYAFEAALHIFPISENIVAPQGLAEWNEKVCWKSAYGGLLPDSLLCFAEDIFGGQFCILDGEIIRLDPETAGIKSIASTLDAWSGYILDNYEVETGYPLAHSWQLANGSLEPGKRLLPKKPFVIGGPFTTANLFPMNAASGMRLRGEIAQQIANLPDGTEIEIEYC